MTKNAQLTTTIFGHKLDLDFLGYADDEYGFKIEFVNWNKGKYTDFQNKLFDEYIDDHIQQYEEIINNIKHEL